MSEKRLLSLSEAIEEIRNSLDRLDSPEDVATVLSMVCHTKAEALYPGDERLDEKATEIVIEVQETEG